MQRAMGIGSKQQNQEVNLLHGGHPSSAARLGVLVTDSVHTKLQWELQSTELWGLAGACFLTQVANF